MAEEFDVIVDRQRCRRPPIAYELAGANARILILEKGPRLRELRS